jgi:uncharacterized membrane protein (DUF373 family)
VGETTETPAEGDARRDEAPADLDQPHIPAAVTALARVQDVVYYVIAVVLLLLSAGALLHTIVDFVVHESVFAERVTSVVNGVLFVVITLELLRTVIAHFEDASFQLKPFMIIVIISVVRHILTVGAELSLKEENGGELWHRADVELGINALVVLALVVGLVLLRETE